MIKKIHVSDLQIGMYVTDMNNTWIPQQNSRRRGLIKAQKTIDQIRLLGVSDLFIDTEKGLDVQADSALSASSAMAEVQREQFESLRIQAGNLVDKPVPFSTERGQAEKVHSEAKLLIGDILNEIKSGKVIDSTAVSTLADDLITSLDNNSDALSCLTRIRTKDAYLLEHSVNVGILLGIFARALQLERSVVHDLVTGGLLHDVGKIIVPETVLNKPGKLDAEEWEEMKRHVNYGERILDATAGLSDVTRSICAQHHERMDGTGYPRGLSGAKISLYGRMSAVVDVYDAITADRVYHKGMSPHEALKKLIEWSVFHLDKELVYQFIRCISIYPVGTVVELDNGHAGVVIEANPGNPLEPVVRVFYTVKHRHYIEPHVIDLAGRNVERKVVGTVEPAELGIREIEFI